MSKKNITLTEEGKNFEIGFGGKHTPLGERSEAELREFLRKTVYPSRRADYLQLFENPPSLEELNKDAADEELSKNAVYSPHALHLPAGTEVKSAAPATDQAHPNAGQTGTSGDLGGTAAGPVAAAPPAPPAGPATVTGFANRTGGGAGTGGGQAGAGEGESK
jgi:hypothetical protein